MGSRARSGSSGAVNSETQRKGDEPLPPDDCDKPICSDIRTATETSNNAMLIFFIFVERFSAPNPTDSARLQYFYHVPSVCQQVTHQRGRIWVARLVLPFDFSLSMDKSELVD